MTFLTPWPALFAAAIAVPLLLLLYVLKLRRAAMRIPSTLLWRSSARDLQANVPFQRLHPSWLLLLQLALLVLLLAALAQPVIEAGGRGHARTILLIDHSASMRATDAGGDPPRTRLDAALDAARQTVRRVGRRSAPSQVMIVAFASTAQVACGFESSQRVLLDALDAIEPTDEPADLAAALRLASAFARRDETADVAAPEVVLFSDGIVAPPSAGGPGDAGSGAEAGGGFELDAGQLRFVGIGPSPGSVRNVGITNFSARRDYERPEQVLVFARLLNAGAEPVQVTTTLRADGEAVESRAVSIPPAGPDGAGEAAVSLRIDMPRPAILSLTCAYPDALAADNVAALVVPPAHAPRIGVVYAGASIDPFLLGLLEAMEPERLSLVPATDPIVVPWGAGDVDMAVYDRVSGPLDTGLPTLTFGAAPQGLTRRPATRPGAGRVLSWQRVHPLLRHVSLDALRYVGHGGYDVPDGWEAVAVGPEGPVIIAGSAGHARHVAVGFALRDSNWPMDVSIAVFLQNAVEFLVRGATRDGMSFRPGEPIAVRALPDAQELRVQGPAASIVVPVRPGSDATVAVPRVGVYTVAGVAPPLDRLAVNLADANESDLRPRRDIVVNARRTEAGAVGDAAPLELWPALTVAALGLLAIEWLVYCLRARSAT